MERKTIGAFIAALRKANGLTQKQLAEKLNVTDKAVSRWEREESAPDLSLIPMIADVFGITADELLRGQRRTDAPAQKPHQTDQKSAQLQICSIISFGLALMGLLVAFICRFAIGYRYGVLGYCLGLLFYLAAGVCQSIFTVSALTQPNTPAALRDRIAGTSMKLYILLFGLILSTIPVANSSLDFWEVLFVGCLIAVPSICAGIMVSWFAVIPHLAPTKGLFREDADNEALQNLRKETVFWGLWVIGIWILLFLTFSTISRSTDWLLIAGLVILLLTIPISMVIYLYRKKHL